MTTNAKTDSQYSVDDVVENLKTIDLPPDWGDNYNRLVATVYREIARGKPINAAAADTLITDAGVELEAGREFLAGVGEMNDGGDIVGSVGLSQNQHPHRFEVDGVELATWCAWDTLFIAPVIKKLARVSSNAPGSNAEVKLEVGPDGVTSPEGSVMSFVMLEPGDISTDSLESVYMLFCHQIHFFPNREEAEQWTRDRDYKFAILSIDEAYEVGQRAFADMLRVA
ncbi:MAG: hypothetical protein IH960_11375 [Chloroflexi bacterium]|nr:hypothetical protein [Chloroflexota bacterium]